MAYKRLFVFFCANNILSSESNEQIQETDSMMKFIARLQPVDEVFKHIAWEELSNLMFEHMRYDHEGTID